jgi:Lar family restriction alleviation protein
MIDVMGCPFCGHDNEDDLLPHDMREDDYQRESPGCQMRCVSCGARGPEESNRREALESWNRRKAQYY